MFGCLGCGAGSTENLQQLSQYHSGLHRTPSLTRHHRSGIPVLMAASSGLKSLDAGLMCVYVLIICCWPTRILLWDTCSCSYILVQLSLKAAPEIWEHRRSIIYYAFLLLWCMCMYMCPLECVHVGIFWIQPSLCRGKCYKLWDNLIILFTFFIRGTPVSGEVLVLLWMDKMRLEN